jgi:MFS family permease
MTALVSVRDRVRSLLISRDFALLWGGQTISSLGTQLTGNAIPLIAILNLHATATQVSFLAILGTLPFLFVSMPAGALVDRLPRRGVMQAADIGRALILSCIPLAALLGVLRIETLAIAFFLGQALSVFFEMAYHAYVPSLLAGKRLIAGNSRLAASESFAEASGPALAGVLVQTLGGLIAIALDVVSFVVSAASLGMMRTRQQMGDTANRDALWPGIVAGWRVIWRTPLLRMLILGDTLGAVAGGFFLPLYPLFVLHTLQIAPAPYGVLVSLGGVSALVGAASVAPFARRLGVFRAILLSRGLMAVGQLLVPLAAGPLWWAYGLLAFSQLGGDSFGAYYGIITTSLRQERVPERYLGRVNACFRLSATVALLAGMLLTGALAPHMSVRLLLLLGSSWSIGAFAVLWLGLASVSMRRAIHEKPEES